MLDGVITINEQEGSVMNTPILTSIHGRDPISRAGVASQLKMRSEIRIVETSELADVALVVADRIDEHSTRELRVLRNNARLRLLLVATVVDDAALVAAAEVGVVGLLRREDASPDQLVRTIVRVAAGDGSVPPDLLGRLLEQVGRLQRQVLTPRGLVFAGLTPREAEVLRLVADGRSTSEIACTMCYSERTVKNVLHDLVTRLQLRNRTHAVAYALREGLI